MDAIQPEQKGVGLDFQTEAKNPIGGGSQVEDVKDGDGHQEGVEGFRWAGVGSLAFIVLFPEREIPLLGH